MASERLSNVIGAPFTEYVLSQLNIRAAHNSTGGNNVPVRSQEDILFLANKMAWVKLTSSVKVTPGQVDGKEVPITKFYKDLGLDGYTSPDDLRKNWTLSAGTSISDGANINLRYGIGDNGAYGLGGTEELGYRPMPGLSSVTIETRGTLGSLRDATINFKVWNMYQLNIVEALYFRLGYSMLLEWGHNQFFQNYNPQGGGNFVTNTYGINPFVPNLRKEIIQQQVAKRSEDLSGNYDAMLGIVTNFHWSFNQDGGYDCTVRMVGLGSIIDTLKINLSYKMPATLFEVYKSQNQTLQDQASAKAAQVAKDKEQTRRAAEGLPSLPETPTNPQEIYTNIYTIVQSTNPPPLDQNTFLAEKALPAAYNIDTTNQTVNTVFDYYYKTSKEGKISQSFSDELNQKRTGLFLSPITGLRNTWTLVPTENYPTVVLSLGLLNETAIRADQLKKSIDYAVAGINPGKGYVDLQNSNLIGSNSFVKAFDFNLYRYPQTTISTAINAIGNNLTLGVDDPIFTQYGAFSSPVPLAATFLQTAYVVDPITKSKKQTFFTVTLTYTPISNPGEGKKAEDLVSRPTRREFIAALEDWFLNSRKVQITSIENTSNVPNNVTVKGDIVVNIAKKPPANLTIEFTNTALIQSVLASPVLEKTLPNATQNGDAGNTSGVDNNVDDAQVDPGNNFASALHAMLVATKSQIQTAMGANIGTPTVTQVDLTELTKAFFKDGILSGIFDAKEDNRKTTFDLQQYALKGFNSNLMVNPKLISKVPIVNFTELATGYGIPYVYENSQEIISQPTYIKLGYLLAFLNSMCLIYDSTVNDADKNPYVYLDFNPKTNFCLSNPQHLSVDPFTCMIPYQGNNTDYLRLFPLDITPNPASTEILFGKDYNAVSGYLPKFKINNNNYQGATMEILLNIDFLVNILKQFITSSQEHAVNLKGFLDAIMIGINKSTGGLNSFRVSYRDDSNTVIIKDDQFVPPSGDEAWMLSTSSDLPNPTSNQARYGVPEGVSVPKYGQLPVFGKQSLVREMRFETNMTTKISSIIAISGQAQTGSVNSTDHSSFSWLNNNFTDSYKPRVTNSSTVISKTKKDQQTEDQDKKIQEENDQKNAIQFNQHIVSIYYGKYTLAKSKVDQAINYYINSISEVKAADNITVAAPFIPANLNITLDGIAGIVMGNAFTIPEDRLPLSLRGPGGTIKNTKVGFIVVGLTHVIESNQWLTKIRGQMIRLRDSSDYGVVDEVARIQASFPSATDVVATGALGNCKYGLGCQRRNGNAYLSAKLMSNKAFTDAVDKITEDYHITDKTALYKVMYAESRLDPNNPNNVTKSRLTGRDFAAGLIQFTPDDVITKDNPKGIIPSLDLIARTSPINQLPYVRKYLDQYPAIRGGGIYELYAAIFFPAALNHLNDPNWIIQSKRLSAYKVSYSNPAISCAAGKQPGEALTIADFKKYVDCIS